MAAEEWVYLRHPETEGVQHVPASAVEIWQAIGWEPTDPPVEPNPALAEYIPYPRPAAPARARKPKSEVVETTTEASTEKGDE